MAHRFVASARDSGNRLDLWLCKRLPGLSRKRIKRLIDEGRVAVNRKRVVIAGWKLGAGDRVVVGGDEGRQQHAPDKTRHGLKVLFEDRDIIVVEKPAGLHAVAPPSGAGRRTLVAAVKAHLKQRYRKGAGSYVSPLHRLDVETSGVMVLAKSHEGEKLKKQFRDHTIARRYIAVVEGALDENDGVIDRPIEKGRYAGGRKARVASGGGRRARTEFAVRERYADATLLGVTVHTGRTHQIRVHFSMIGHPVVGDKLYGGRIRFRRQALHAAAIGFRHPVSGEKLEFHSPLPPDMEHLIDELRERC